MEKSAAYTSSRNGFGASSCLEDPDTEPLQLSEAYVHSLASLGLERLQNEPGRLRAEAMAVEEALHSLSLDHYRVFIQNQECVRHVQAQGQAMEGHLAALLADVHGLGAEFSVFQREAAELVGGHKRNRQTLKHHMQLVELLEVPQLMDACVRSDLIEEALSIATFASTLERRHRSRRAITSSSDGEGEDDEKAAAPSGQLPGVIGMIVDEVRQSARGLHERLVAKLKGPIQLTTCLQVVSCLRRLELLVLEERNERKLLQQQQQKQQGYADGAQAPPRGKGIGPGKGVSALGGGGARGSGGDSVGQRQLALVEVKLQVEFLEARDAWLADSANRVGHADLKLALAGGTPTSPYQTLMDLIETSRSQWFEVATQFRAVFSSVDGGTGMGTGMGGVGRKAKGGRREEGAAGAGRPESGDVLSLWLLRRVSAFVDQLKTLLPLVEDGGLLRSLLEECMFFGASMGRLGTDFRGLLVPVFEERVIGVAVGQWASASADFLVTLRDIAAIEDAGGNGASLLHVPDKISASFGGSSVGGAAGEAPHVTALSAEGGPPPPPRPLMAFPPVARLVNLVLTSFNQLRECLPSSVEARLADALVQCFADVFQGLADLEKSTVRANAAAAAEAAAGKGAQGYAGRREANTTTRAIELACVSLAERAVPHVALCFAVLFGDSPATAIASTIASTAKASNEHQGPVAGKRRGALLLSRMLKSMETFGIYEPPPAPPIKVPAPAQLSMLAPESTRPVVSARPAPGEESGSEGMLSEGASTPAAKGSRERPSAGAPLENQLETTESDRVNGGSPESLQH